MQKEENLKKAVKAVSVILSLIMCLGMVSFVFAADQEKDDNYYYFTDRSGNEMKAPKYAFATRVVSFTPGDPWTKEKDDQDPDSTLGLPDYTSSGKYNNLCMGAGGVLVLEFNIAVYDGEGDDIYVFEIGGDVEATFVEVSNDLSTWYEAGKVGGATAGVDLAGKVPENSKFRYVRLTDLKTSIHTAWPGADIDAVSGLNSKAVTSDWADSEIYDPEIEDPLIPDSLIGKDLTLPITRAEFAGVSVKVYENLSNTKALPAVINPFIDTTDLDVLKAFNVGITNGIGDNLFAPDSLLNREQCATMLTRVFKRSTMPGWTLETDSQFHLSYVQPALFADDRYISDWARDSVYFMAANTIINGMGDNLFAPKNMTPEQEALGYANATREQALVIAVRMVKKLR